MEQFIWVVIPLIVAGLGFVTYRHPLIGRKIVFYLMFATGGVFILSIVYHTAAQSAFNSSLDATRITIYTYHDPSNLHDDLAKAQGFDSILLVGEKFKLEQQHRFEIVENEKIVKDSIAKIISKELKVDKQNNDSVFVWCGICYATLFVFMLLSYMFEPLWQPNSKPQNNSPSQTP
jgi:hypothetical protein